MNIDLEIAKKCNMLDINDIARKLDIDLKYIENYGKYKAKISLDIMENLYNQYYGIDLNNEVNSIKQFVYDVSKYTKHLMKYHYSLLELYAKHVGIKF